MAANRRRRDTLRWLAAGAAAPLLASLPALAQDTRPRARPNVEYRPIAPQPVPPGPVIEVIEFFWYGCPYCYELQPALDAWLARKPPDVAFRRVPATFRATWVPHARLYYTLEALGALQRLHRQVYEAYHVQRIDLGSEAAIAEWAAREGIERDQWLANYHSPDTDRKVEAAHEMLRRYSIGGTPSVVVDGRYLTSSGMTAGAPAVVPVVEDLIERVREERAGR